MTGAGTAGGERRDCDEAAVGKDPTPDPAPVDSPMRKRILERVRVLRSLRNPTVAQIEAAQFWEDYTQRNPMK